MKYFYSSLIIVLVALIAIETAIAGGLIHNSNQSAAYCRMMVRDASTDIDAVFYNPAGLTALPEGLFFSVNNQSIFQTRTITNDYQFLNEMEYEGEASAPLFPGVYLGYKFGDFVLSAGFNPVGGGGGAEYAKGLPSFHLAISDLVPSLGGKENATYTTDIYFKGTSVYYGFQGGLSYKINNMISLFLGARYIMAQNNYEGYLRNTNITTKLPMAYSGRADAYLNNVAEMYKNAKEQFASAGMPDSAAVYGMLEAGARIKATLLGDQEAEVEQTGTGITPIIGANFTLLDNKLVVGLKYEHATPLVLKNKTTKDIKVGFGTDYITQFPDEKEYNQDIPALLSIGASYQITNDITCATGFHYYFDDKANWDGHQDSLDGNSIEFGLGLEYTITDDLLLSTGWLMTANGVTEGYQSDMNYSLPTNSFALGGKYKLMNNLDVNLGFIYVVYGEGDKKMNRTVVPKPGVILGPYDANYTFAKSSIVFALGLDYYFGGK